MSRPSFVRHRDVKAAIKAAEAAGQTVYAFKVSPDGSITVMTTGERDAPPPTTAGNQEEEYEELKRRHHGPH